MRDSNQPYIIFTFVAGMLLTVCVVVVAVFIATQRPNVVVVPAAATAVAPAPGPAAPTQAPPAAADDDLLPAPVPTLTAARVDQLPPLDDPLDARWSAVDPVAIHLMPQQLTSPMLEQASISEAELQAVHDGQTIALRLSWAAPRSSTIADTSRFSDGAALQFPLKDGASFMMGAADQPVQILQWKALWQRDVDEGFVDVQDLYPNTWVDLYWFAENSRPRRGFRVTESFSDPRSAPWFIAQQAGNPMFKPERTVPIEEAIAEGYGSLTALPESRTLGRGRWHDGRWVVVFHRPIGSGGGAGDELAQRLAPGQSTSVAAAVWDGSAQNVGGRKHYSNWIPLEIAR